MDAMTNNELLIFISELLLQQRKKRISMTSMDSQESTGTERNDDKCKNHVTISLSLYL